MKKELVIGISLLVLIIAGTIIFAPGQNEMISGIKSGTAEQQSAASTGQSNDVAGRISSNLVLKETSKSTVDTVLVYKTQPPVVNKEATMVFAKKFNVTGTLRGETTVQSEDLIYGITLTKNSGSAEYSNHRRPNAIQDAPEKLPSDEDAIKIATKFLKDRDLYPEGAVEPIALRENTFSSNGIITFGQIGVWYHRYLNSLKVEGTQLVVYVGGNGDVIGYYANWRNYEPYKEYPLISPDDAFNRLKVKGVGVGMNDKDSMVSIDDVYLAYHSKAGAYKEDYLEPVWVFTGNVEVEGKEVMPVQAYIPALNETPLPSGKV